MNFRALILVFIVWPTCALADTWVPITSEIPGVQLWGLRPADDENPFPSEIYEGDDNEFMRHCNSGRSIYISVLEKSVKCQFKRSLGNNGLYNIYVKTKDKRTTTQRLVVVSKNPIPPRIKPLPITLEEIEKLRKAEQASVATNDQNIKSLFKSQHKESTEQEYAEYLRTIKASKTYRKYSGARFKLPSPSGFIYISAVGLNSSEYIGWEIINVIYHEIDGQMQEIGVFEGCIQGGFRDLNSDGTPEVLTSTCENGEATSDAYWTLTPKVRKVLAH
jgi:hypothetical protein